MAFVSTGMRVATRRGLPTRSTCARHGSKVTTTRMVVMSEDNSDKIADFTRMDFAEAGKEFQGVVFQADTEEFPLTRARVQYEKNCEDAVNNQINVEYTASYAYHAIASYFDRDTVALPGFAKFFKDQSLEERDHADKLMQYQSSRGGQVVLKPVAVPVMQFNYVDGTSDALYAMDLHLQLEILVFEKLRNVHEAAEVARDVQLMDFIESMLGEQTKAIKVAASYVAQVKRVGTGHGVYHIDQNLLEGKLIPAPQFDLAA